MSFLLAFLSLAWAGPGSVAVMYFQDQGNPALAPLKVGLAQMLTSDLVGAGAAKLVERQQLQAIMDEQKLGHSAVVDKDTAAKLGKLLGAEYLVLGSYFEFAGTLRVDARLVRVETGEIVASHGANGTVTGFLEIEKSVATQLRASLAVAVPGEAPPAALAPPPEPTGKALDAAMALSEGLIALDSHELPRARASFEAAIAADPRLDEARAQLASLEL